MTLLTDIIPLKVRTITRACAKRKFAAEPKLMSAVENDGERGADPTPGGNADGYQNKGVAGKAICKTMKTKGRQKKANDNAKSGDVAEVPHTPGVLLKESASC